MFLHSELQVQVPATTTRIHAMKQEGNQHLVFLVLVLSFSPFELCQSSPVFCELRPLVHFDGELLMVSFVVSYLQLCIFFWVGIEGQRLCGGGVISLVYRVNL